METKISRTIEELPALKEAHARLVHLTDETSAESISKSGLRYKGMISSTARAYSNPNDTEFVSEDPRFSGSHVRAVVIDMPFEELRLHDWRTGKSGPGIVPKEYIVGIVKPRKTTMTDEEFRDYSMRA